MARKKWVPETEITPSLLKFREKRKWQISLRRYVLEKNKCVQYAPYFGLDIEKMRQWLEMQFVEGLGWEDFGKKWQFDHIIPVNYFDFSDNNELLLCWNFTNIRVEALARNKDRGHRLDVLAAKGYFETLYQNTNYLPCLKLIQKIDRLELSGILNSDKQREFILQNRPFLDMIENYSSFEFELLNSGRSAEEVMKEVNFLKKF